MPGDRLANDSGGARGAADSSVWALPIAFLVGLWLWLAFSSGGYPARNWIFPAFALGVVGLVIASLVAYPRRPRQLSMALLALAAGYCLWTLASDVWAQSGQTAWVASGRTLVYLLVLAIALIYFTSPKARLAFRYLLMLAAFILILVSLWRLWISTDITPLFSARRLAFPADEPDSAAALFLIAFWPLLWLAAGPEERAPVRGTALGLATGLVGLAVMTQSRAATWSVGITLVLLFILSPGRVRLLFYLVVPGLLMVYAFPTLNRYWTLGPAAVEGANAARAILVAIIAAGFMGTILALLEGWIKVTRRMRAIFGTVVSAACVAALVYGALTFTRDLGGPVTWFHDSWTRLTDEQVVTDSPLWPDQSQRASSREAAWKLAWAQLQARPIVGSGADNAGLEMAALLPEPQTSPADSSRVSGSFIVQILGDTGIIGGVIAFGALLVALMGILWPRFAAGWHHFRKTWWRKPAPGGRQAQGGPEPTSRWGDRPKQYGWDMALFTGAAFWFVYADIHWLWQVPAVTVPALLMLAAAISRTDARAGTIWPRLDRWRVAEAPESTGPNISPNPVRYVAGGRPSPGTETSDGGDRPAGVQTREGDENDPAGTRDKGPGRLSRRLWPLGPLSQGFRIGIIVLSAAVLVLALSVYLMVLL